MKTNESEDLLMTDKKYCIQLAECDGNSKEVYSFDEVEIGTWVDGKPIYRKVIPGKLANDSGNGLVFANVSGLKVDRVVNLYGTMTNKDGTGQAVFPVSYNMTSGLQYAINMYYNLEAGDIAYHFLNTGGSYSGCTAYVVLEYTKN
jgi:hypothetical protein